VKAVLRSAGVLAVAFLLLHVPFLPASLEDLDSINFALGIRDFDVTQHQPHPPGYPLYIAAAKLVHLLVANEARALALLSAVCGALAIVALARWFRRIDPAGLKDDWIPVGVALTAATPLFWFTANRPLSDVPGLAAVIGVQALILGARTTSRVTLAAFVAAIAAGIRSQIWWLTAPMLLVAIVMLPARDRVKAAVRAGAAFVVGTLVWFVPLLLITGPAAYFKALAFQGNSDLDAENAILWVTHTPRQLLLALTSTFIAPWATPYVAVPALCAVMLGAVVLLLRSRRTLLMLAVAFGPYLVFDLLFQESVTTRYALPLVIPFSYLATRGLAALPPRVGFALAGVLIAASVWPAAQDLRAYAAQKAPAFQMLDDMASAAQRGERFVLAAHRREEFDMRRPRVWDEHAPEPDAHLLSPPKREWMEVVNYWNRGGREPVWWIADPLRNDLALIDHGHARGRYRWPLQYPLLVGGARPNVMDWYVLDRPSWYLGRGWAVTPEAAGVSAEDRQAPDTSPIQGWVRRRPEQVTLIVGGRNFAGATAQLHVSIDERTIDDAQIAPGFFLRMIDLPPGSLNAPSSGDYAALTASAQGKIAIEQFDAQSRGHLVFGFGAGWHEAEYNPLTGLSWRWMSERGELRVRGATGPRTLHVAGVTEGFSKPSHVTVRQGDRVLARFEAGANFDVRAGIPANVLSDTTETTLAIETDQAYVPAERKPGSGDRRHLALKVLICEFVP
jgi:hypothetical protein